MVLTGTQRERALAKRIAVVAGLSAHSVVAHLATALGIPSVTLFGPSPPSEWGPLVDRERYVVLWARNGSSPPSVADIRTDAVLAALSALP